jgi:hypothetical protein
MLDDVAALCRSGGFNTLNLYIQTRNLGPCPDEDHEETVKRAAKYVARLNYLHFSQFSRPLESITKAEYETIMGGEA